MGASRRVDDNRDGAARGSGDPRPVHVGVLVAPTPNAAADALAGFAVATTDRAGSELAERSGRDWQVHRADPHPLSDGAVRRPADFLDEAADRMVRAPYDALVVVTDARIRSRRYRYVPGVASPSAHVAVVSTRRLRGSPRGEPAASLENETVRANGATLVAHLLGHVAGLSHSAEGLMRPPAIEPDRSTVPPVAPEQRSALESGARRLATGRARPDGFVARAGYYAATARSNWRRILGTLVRNRAPLVSLSLPALASAAVIPTLILVFSAETWDVGVHLSNATAATFFIGSILAASGYTVVVHGLLYPREPGVTAPPQFAVLNLVVGTTMVAATAGLFAAVAAVMLVIELVIFPADLITTWPSLEDPTVGFLDLVRTAGFISAIGTLTGALAGGLESRTIIHHLALFHNEP